MVDSQPADGEDSPFTMFAPDELYFAFDGETAHYVETIDVPADQLREGTTVADVATMTKRIAEYANPDADVDAAVDGGVVTCTMVYDVPDAGRALGALVSELLLVLREHYPATFDRLFETVVGRDEDQGERLLAQIGEELATGEGGADAPAAEE